MTTNTERLAQALPEREHNPLRGDEPIREQEAHAAYVNGWNACRQAALAALSQHAAEQACQCIERPGLCARYGCRKESERINAEFNAAQASHAAPKQAEQQAGPVASIYISADGSREFDDWKCPLPVGRNELYTHPAPSQERDKVAAGLLDFVLRIAKQTPEKPDYWSSCGQCDSNISDAEDLIDARAAGKEPQHA